MNWPTLITSMITAILAAFLAAFLNQHFFWKKQKLRQQRISIAERFVALHARLHPADSEVDFSARFEEHALIVLVQLLFEREDTLRSASQLKAWFDAHPIQLDGRSSISVFLEAWKLRIDLVSRLFAEAFEISTDRIERL